MKPNKELCNQLLQAYKPCPGFKTKCACMKWNPKQGHVPRGFCGAIGELSDVKLILVCAEPGDPHKIEKYVSESNTDDIFKSVSEYVWNCFLEPRDLFHKNIRKILNYCFPEQSFKNQMTKTWITDSVLCSAKGEGGHIPVEVEKECIKRFLIKQKSLFPNASIVTLGNKAKDRLKRVGMEIDFRTYAAAPPGYNLYKNKAEESWKKIPEYIKK
jgi:hypothetical protein